MIKTNIKAVLNTQRVDLKGNYPLRVRTTIKRKVTYYATGIMLKKEQLQDGVIINHPNKTLLNASLRKKINEIETDLMEQAVTGEVISKRKKDTGLKFSDYANRKIKEWTGTQTKVTINHKKSYLNKFLDFAPNVKLKDVNKELISEYEGYCRSIGNIGNTVWSAVKFVKTIMNAAVEDEVLPKSPLKGFNGTKYADPLRQVLTADEIKLMEGFADNHINNAKLRHVANYFILGCYTGLRYADMINFPGIVDDRIILQTQKTGSVVSILATEQIKRACKRITGPIYSNQKCNEYIQSVCAIIGVEKKISFHSSRHSYACLFLELGGDIYFLSKLLGHSSLKTTSIYAKISNPALDKEMKKVFG